MRLSKAHREMLERGSVIDPGVIESRRYETVDDPASLKALGFGAMQRRIPGLLVPIHGVDGNVALHQYRPDDPRKDRRGKVVKYETAVGSSLRIDVPPGALAGLRDVSTPLYITEGPKKADCAVSHGLCCVALMGVNGYRGKRRDGTTGELDDWDDIPLEGREVRLAFDSDVVAKPPVRRALDGLADLLRRRKASVRYVMFPHPEAGKVGLDEWFAGGGDVGGLTDLIVDRPDRKDRDSASLLQTWSEFSRESEDVEWLVEGLLPSEGTSVLIAQPKVGKTTFVYWLARCVALGTPFLGRKVEQGGVVLLLAEGSKAMHQSGLTRTSLPSDAPVHIYAGSFSVGLAKICDEIRRLATKPRLIVVDTLFKMLRPKDGNDYAPMVQAMETITDLARELGAHVLCTHHSSKGVLEGASVGSRSLGSTAIYGAVDTTLSLDRRGDRRTVQSEQRWGEPLQNAELTFDEVSGEVALGGSSAERHLETIGGRIIGSLADEPLTESEIKARVKDKAVVAVLRDLVREGRVLREGKGAKGNPYRYSLMTEFPAGDAEDSRFSFSPLYKEERETTMEAVRVL